MLVFFSSCSQQTSNRSSGASTVSSVAVPEKFNFEKGIVISKVRCNNDTTQSYSLYLPSGYSVEKKFPVIYFFDSHGNGILPVEKYKQAAEKYQYIIAGSNNSKNGLSPEIIQNIIHNFFDDTQQKLSIDKNRIYTAGFSGGARIAGGIAINEGGVAGVIACSAGLPQTDKLIENSFTFLGFVGTEDFNYHEMKEMDAALSASGSKHHLLVFEGKHEYPSEKMMEYAFFWSEFNCMRNNFCPKNDSLINTFIYFVEEQNQRNGKGNLAVTHSLLKRKIEFLDGITDVLSYKKSLEDIEKSESYRILLMEQEKIKQEESATQKKYADAFVNKNNIWWANEINRLNKLCSSGKNKEMKWMNSRLLSYISIMAYTYTGQALRTNQMEAAEMFLKIYATVAPKNPDHRYFTACYYAKKGNSEKAIDALKDASLLGFTEWEKALAESAFQYLKDNPEFKAVTHSF